MERAATVLATDPDGNERLVAFLQAAEAVDADKLENTLRDRIPSSLVPYLYMRMQRLPLLGNGEVDPTFPFPSVFVSLLSLWTFWYSTGASVDI